MAAEDSFKVQHKHMANKFIQTFSSALHWFEIFLAIISILLVIMGSVHLLSEMTSYDEYLESGQDNTVFVDGLSFILLLVVGVELAIMLVRRTPESLLEVMFFVVARKMLIKTEHIYELLLGISALAILFAIRKYLQK